MAHEPEEEPKIDRRSLRWVEHRQRRLEELIESACEAVREYGHVVSMDQIADFSGTSKSILYRYFVDKEGLQFQIGERVMGELVTWIRAHMETADTTDDMLYGAVDEYLKVVESDPQVYLFMRVGQFDGVDPETDPRMKFDDVILGIIRNAAGSDYLGDEQIPKLDVLVRLWTVGAVALVRGIGEKWLTVRELADDVAEKLDGREPTEQDYLDAGLDSADLGLVGLERDRLSTLVTSIMGRIVDRVISGGNSIFTGDFKFDM